jgi:hypothetical protein
MTPEREESTPRVDSTSLTLEAPIRSWRSLEVHSSADFWSAMRGRFGVSAFAFSTYLPDDGYVYILAAVPELGTPETMIIPEKYRRELPPLPSILNLAAAPTVFMRPNGVYQADAESIRRVSEPLEPES